MTYLVDTNVVSELRKGLRCDRNVSKWFAELAPDDICLSVIVIGEIRRGIERIRRRDAEGSRALEAWLEGLVAAYGERILPVDLRVAEEWGRMNVPDLLPVVDGLMAATAKVHGLVLATRNVKDVARTGARLFDPWGHDAFA